MASYVQWDRLEALTKRLKALEDGLNPDSPGMQRFRSDVKQMVTDDHKDRLLRGVDKAGKRFAELAPRTKANPKRGSGPPLVPRRESSRFIANFEAIYQRDSGGYVLVGRYKNILSKQGKPFAVYHLVGTATLPRRDPSGISRKTYEAIRQRQLKLVRDLIRRGTIS